MMRDELYGNREMFLSTIRLEDILPECVKHAVYSKYLASDLLKRLDGCAGEAEDLINTCLSKAVANDEVPVVMQRVVGFMVSHQQLKSFYTKVISKAEDVLGTYSVDYSIEPHPTSPGMVIIKTKVVTGEFEASPKPVQVRSACLPASSSWPDDERNDILGIVAEGLQQLEAIVRYAPLKPSVN